MGVAVKAIVRDGDGRILLIRRPVDAARQPGLWDLPGGKLDHGETLQEALVREAREETGITVSVGDPIHIDHFAMGPVWVTCVSFACDYSGDEIRLSDEHDDFAWIDVSQIDHRDYAIGIREQLDGYAASVA
jgi:8-oxo-dGTP diphosphatase